jgi:hypothetical protein
MDLEERISFLRSLLSRPIESEKLEFSGRESVPREPGVYAIYDREGHLLYIGESVDLRRRILSHHRSGNMGGAPFEGPYQKN